LLGPVRLLGLANLPLSGSHRELSALVNTIPIDMRERSEIVKGNMEKYLFISILYTTVKLGGPYECVKYLGILFRIKALAIITAW
jgi:hypothetical protein